jgi:hypothetical protein
MPGACGARSFSARPRWGKHAGRKAPGKLGWLFSKPFSTSRKATDVSGGAGRRLGQRLRS